MRWGLGILLLVGALPISLAALETRIKGSRMELIDKGEKVLFSGGVQLRRGSDTMRAVEMTTTKKQDEITAKGDVRLRREVSPTETWEASGAHGFYNAQNGSGYLLGGKSRAHLIRTEVVSSTVTRRVDIFARRFDFAKDQSTAVARGDVYGKTIDPQSAELSEFWSESADYDGHRKRIVLVGSEQPRLEQVSPKGRRTITGNVITYFIDEKRLISDGDAQAVVVDVTEED